MLFALLLGLWFVAVAAEVCGFRFNWEALFLKRHQEALQGCPKLVQSGSPQRNCMHMHTHFCGRAVVATFDISAANLDELQADHCLAERRTFCYCGWRSPRVLDW